MKFAYFEEKQKVPYPLLFTLKEDYRWLWDQSEIWDLIWNFLDTTEDKFATSGTKLFCRVRWLCSLYLISCRGRTVNRLRQRWLIFIYSWAFPNWYSWWSAIPWAEIVFISIYCISCISVAYKCFTVNISNRTESLRRLCHFAFASSGVRSLVLSQSNPPAALMLLLNQHKQIFFLAEIWSCSVVFEFNTIEMDLLSLCMCAMFFAFCWSMWHWCFHEMIIHI